MKISFTLSIMFLFLSFGSKKKLREHTGFVVILIPFRITRDILRLLSLLLLLLAALLAVEHLLEELELC